MKILAVIPARYESSRFEGKPLAQIINKPMIWWTYQQVKKCKNVDEIVVATDDERIEQVCKEYDMNVLMTSKNHKMMLERVWEVSEKIKADGYISIAGDEPLIEPSNIDLVAKSMIENKEEIVNLKTLIKSPVDVLNWTTMKVVCDKNEYIVFASRSPIPYPKATTNIKYYKHMGTYGLTKKSLNFFKKTERGNLENIEDFDLLRFIENRKEVKTITVESETVSVDTPKDLDRVSKIIESKLK